jgi:hypothetical protein
MIPLDRVGAEIFGAATYLKAPSWSQWHLSLLVLMF